MILNRTTSTRIALFILTVICFQTTSHAQLNAGFFGDASFISGNCYEVTPDAPEQSGAVWYNNPIDFANDFTIYYQNNFGTKNAEGADGMALVFKRGNDILIGSSGNGLGYSGIPNSLIVEFDTHYNSDIDDPTFDHVAIMSNGQQDHSEGTNLMGPVQASDTNVNIEDGQEHEVKIVWSASTETFEVYFDCNLRLSLTQDLKTDIFGGDDSVFFGFVGTTGTYSNLHKVCFNSISFVDTFDFVDTNICVGDALPLDATIPSGDNYSWTPTTGVSDPTIANPTITPNITTTYTVSITDVCGDISTEDILITVNPIITPVFTFTNTICEDDANPLLNTSNNGITGTWLPIFDATTTTLYTFTPDAGQCANTATLTITVNPKTTPVFTPVADICTGDALTALTTTSNDGITGNWSPALDNNITTIYTFTPDAGQCANTATLTITVNQKINPVFTPVTDICTGDTLAALPLTSNDGIIGTWSPALDNTLTTAYTFTPNTGQCANPANLTITVNQKIDPVFNLINDICNGGPLVPLPLNSNEGIIGTWSPALDNTITTVYTFTPNAGQCANTATLSITVNDKIDTVFDPINDICTGDPLAPLATVSNEGVSGTWSPALDTTTTTLYTFTPGPGECANQSTLTITVNPKIDPVFNPINDICSGDPLALLPTTSTNGIIGTWTPALDNTTTTLYIFTPSVGECANPAELIITVIQKSDPVFTPINAICSRDALAPLPTTSNNGITGNWTPRLDATATTLYTFTPSPWECANTTTLFITVNQRLNPIFTAIDDICNGAILAPLPVTSNDGITGTWSPDLDNTTTTLYTFTPNSWECANTKTLTITVNQKIDPVFAPVDTICEGVVLAPLPTISNEGITGTWSPAMDNTATTIYTFTPNVGECANPSNLTVTVIPTSSSSFRQIEPICAGDTMALLTLSSEGFNGTWSPAIDNMNTTTYTFTANPGECAQTTTMTVVVIPVNVLTISAVNQSENFDANQIISVTASGGSGSYEYQLDGGVWQSSSVFENVIGCDEHTIAVRDIVDVCNTQPETTVNIIEYPKFFTPNGDGFNDTWNIECLRNDSTAVIRIFDRFGKLLIQFKPSQNAWNGTFNGSVLPGSDYWFVINYQNGTGVETQFRSHFSLIR